VKVNRESTRILGETVTQYLLRYIRDVRTVMLRLLVNYKLPQLFFGVEVEVQQALDCAKAEAAKALFLGNAATIVPSPQVTTESLRRAVARILTRANKQALTSLPKEVQAKVAKNLYFSVLFCSFAFFSPQFFCCFSVVFPFFPFFRFFFFFLQFSVSCR
jgi:hypothetical protein